MSWDAVLIAGPTASGKSAAALAVAESFGGTLINADSMQVYRELHVLTARPCAADEARVPHLLYGHVPVAERYSAGRYQSDASRAFAEVRGGRRLPVFVGGTGLYFKTLLEGLSPIPPVPAAVRENVRTRFAEMGAEAFFAAFVRRDPETAAALRPHDTQRILRAAGVWEATGRGLKAWQRVAGTPVLNAAKTLRFVVNLPREVLYARIDARFDAMMETGALTEVRSLAGLDPALSAARALGVRQLLSHLAGKTPLEEAVAAAKTETRRYAKRQMAWFHRFMKDWIWLEDKEIGNIIAVMKEKLL